MAEYQRSVVSALGVTVELTGEVPATLVRALGDLADPAGIPRASIRCVSQGGRWSVVTSDHRVLAVASSDAELPTAAVTALNRLVLDLDADRLHLHAAALEVGGRGLLICGRSGAGKSTLAAALVRRGASYLSDELAPLGAGTRSVAAYAKPFSFKGWAVEQFAGTGNEFHSVDGVLVAGSSLGRIGRNIVPELVVFPKRRTGLDLAVRPVAPGDAVQRLAEELMDASRFGETLLDALVDLVSRVSCWEVSYDDAVDAAGVVEALGPRVEPLVWTRDLGRADGLRRVRIGTESITVDVGRSILGVQRAPALRPPMNVASALHPGARRSAPHDPLAHGEIVRYVVHTLQAVGVEAIVTGRLVERDDRAAPAGFPIVEETVVLCEPEAVERARRALPSISPSAPLRVSGCLDGAAVGSIPFTALIAASVQSRISGNWCATLHPRHRFVQACLRLGAADDARPADIVSTILAGQLPIAMLKAALDEADGWGVYEAVRLGILRAAEFMPGTHPPLAAEIRRRGGSQAAH